MEKSYAYADANANMNANANINAKTQEPQKKHRLVYIAGRADYGYSQWKKLRRRLLSDDGEATP